MNRYIKLAFMSLVIITVSCSKSNDDINAASNAATAASSSLTLNNRVFAAFIGDSSTLPNLAAGVLPVSYNKFRKLLTYDTASAANKPPVYKVGDVINIVTYVKGDDSAIVKRKINFRFFQPPASFVTPTALYPLQKAEDSYRGFVPASADILDFISAPIAPTSTSPFNISIVGKESIGGINSNIYLVQFAYTIPATLLGKLVSVNFTTNTAGAASDIGNVNWIYAFRVK
jgi:hypothetical protein